MTINITYKILLRNYILVIKNLGTARPKSVLHASDKEDFACKTM